MNEHERVEELLAAEALGGLSAEDQAELGRAWDEHGSTCEQCRRAEAEYREVAGRLAFSLQPVAVREGMEDEILDRALRGAETARPRWARRWVAAAAAAVLVVAGGVGGWLTRGTSGPATQALSVARFRGSGAGTLELAYDPKTGAAVVFGSGLSTLPKTKVYELWTFRGTAAPIPSGTFRPAGPLVSAYLAVSVSGAKAVAVTVERAPGVRQPTSAPIFTAPVTS